MPVLELQPGRDGAPLGLSERQQRLIQLQHPDAARVIVKELHGSASAAALERPSRRVLQTVGLDGSGQPAEPTLTKLDAADALVKEVARHDAVAKTLGSSAGRILRRPLYLRDARIAAAGEFSASEHAGDADAALVLELPGACWALPEFSGASTGRQIVAPLQVQLCEAVAAGKASDCATIDETLDELCAALPAACRPPPPPRLPPAPPARSSTVHPPLHQLSARCPTHAGTRRAGRCAAWPPAVPRAPRSVRRRRAAGSLGRSRSSDASRRQRSPRGLHRSS